MPLWLRMNFMPHFICIGFTERRKSQNENICMQLDSNLQPFGPQALYLSATLTGDELCLKVLYYNII